MKILKNMIKVTIVIFSVPMLCIIAELLNYYLWTVLGL